MGGQACILYGAAEFSRDVDLAVLADDRNLRRLRQVLNELHATPVYVPDLSIAALHRGHACHFRANVPPAVGLRVDIMSAMRGCDPFDKLWARRRALTLPGTGRVNVLSLPDLVQAKKTQRDKDWPMIRRLIEADYHHHPRRPPREQIRFWLREARTPELLLELVRRYPSHAAGLNDQRPLLGFALTKELDKLSAALAAEEQLERLADKEYWAPLRSELSDLRRSKRERG